MQTISEVLNNFKRSTRAPLQHLEIGFFAHAENADVAHRLGAAWMASAVEGGGVTTEEIAGHQHFQRAFFPVRRRLDALDGAFFDDVEELGRVAFAENEVALAVPGFGEFLQYALAILPAQYVEQGNVVKQLVGGWPRPFT